MKRSVDTEKIQQASHGAIRIRSIHIGIALIALALSLLLLKNIRDVSRMTQAMFAGQEAAAQVAALISRQRILTAALLVVLLLTISSTVFLILIPMRKYIVQIQENRILNMRGAYELRYLAEAYNLMCEENQKHNDALRYQVEHDHLTGLLNRGAFDRLLQTHRQSQIALMIVDVDNFKQFNDGYGHDMGDQVLQKVAELLSQNFRATDFPCRIGGDEFSVIMTEMDTSRRHVLTEKITLVSEELRNLGNGMPPITLSIGVAFSEQCGPKDDIFKFADAALYHVKKQGRDGCAFYNPLRDGNSEHTSEAAVVEPVPEP